MPTLARTGRTVQCFVADARGDVPMRIGPMLLVGLIFIVLAMVGAFQL